MSTTALFTLDDYDHMIACGAFDPPHHRRSELIRGEIRDMSPIGPEHCEVVDFLNEWSFAVTSRRTVRTRIQSPVDIPELASAPEPDVVWAVRKSYAKRRPQPPDVLLLIEVGDSTVQYDLGEKADLYAEAGITDYWVVDIPNFRVHVHRQPTADGFQSIEALAMGDTIHPLSNADGKLDVADRFACLH